MKKKNFIARFAFSLVVCIWGLMSCSIPTNQIHYTTKDNSILELNPENFGYGQIIISHYFSKEDSVCIIEFSEDVKCIGDWAFGGCISLTSITIPESVTEIGESALRDCISLTSIDIPESVTEIGESAFLGCESLKNITIPKSVNIIGEFAFAGCESLTSITIPESVTEIGEGAFERCSSLTSIDIPVSEIREGTFKGCKSLTTVYVYDFASITDNAFEDCPNVIIEYKNTCPF